MRIVSNRLLAGIVLLTSICITSCRSDDEPLIYSTPTQVVPSDQLPAGTSVKGFFLLNEGNMGSNKASLDFFDYTTGVYQKNIFPERNPDVEKALGDVGNDIAIYGDKLYAVINCSNVVEVMDAHTARHITEIPIPNCRYIAFDGNYAYVSTYAGKVLIDPNARLGYVAKIDTTTLQVVDTCDVGYQPEEMVIVGNKLYVANSGGYRVPNYDNTVSVIDLDSFTEIKKITVAINLHRMRVDAYGNIYVTSRGDYYDVPSNTYVINSNTDMVTDVLDIAASELYLCGDSLYSYSSEYSYYSKNYTFAYTIYDVRKKRVVNRSFIPQEIAQKIEMPYALAVNPQTKEIFLGDAKDFITPGTLYCIDADTIKWEVTTGDIPAHIVFTPYELE